MNILSVSYTHLIQCDLPLAIGSPESTLIATQLRKLPIVIPSKKVMENQKNAVNVVK